MLRAFLGSGLLLWVVLAQSTNGTNHSAQSKGEHGTGQHHEPKGTHHDIHDKPQARPEPEQEKRRGRTESHQRHQREQREQVQQPQQPQVPAAEERNWHEFLPHFARQYTSQRHGEQSEWGQLAAALRASLRGTLLSAEAPDYASVAAREASLRAVSDLEQQEARAAATARDTLHALRQTSSKDILSKASDWHSIQDLVALSRQKDAKSLQDRLEATTKQLEEFSSQQTAAGFNATRAAELMDNLDKAAANAAQSVEVQRKRAKAAIKAARQDALGQVRQLEKRARAAVRSWRSDGRHAVNAQRQANMPEQLYESHDDQMRDAVGDTEQEVENAAEGLKDSINEHYGKLDDELEDVSIGASSKALRHRAEKAQHRLQELARNLGVQAALLEALAKARFAAEEKSWKDLHAPQLLAAVPRSANMSSEVATAQAQEQHAADSFQNSLNSLKDMSTPEVIRKVNGWQTLQELVAGSKPKETDSWEKTLESQTKKLERFNNESRKSALDFDASHAAELADAVEKASWHVEHDAEEQKHRMKATLKDAQRKAHQHVKALEAEAKAAAKSWKYHGRRAVRAQRAAHMPEHVYERHEDHMEDAVGDAEDKAEDAAERLEEQLSHHYEKLEDELADASFDASGKALRQRAEKAQHRLQELARNLGAQAALKEALAKARFAAEEKSWKESHAPQLLDAAASGDHLRGLLIASVFTVSFVAALAFVQRRRPVKVDAPPLLG